MEFRDYFQNEIIALRELAREAMMRNPALAPFFDTPGRDHDIERLLESFSFLVGRLRQKLDDELPEITHGLFSRLWPSYLRPIPAASIIQYQPTENVTGATTIPKGSLVGSVPVEGTRCSFSTVYDVDMLPIQIVEQRILERNGTAILALRFAAPGVRLESLNLSRLRLFLAGEKSITRTLYYTLMRMVTEVRIILKDEEQKERTTAYLTPKALRGVGFQEDEGLYPYSPATLLGYRILQEYFCFPEKFLFVEISELEKGLSKSRLQGFQETSEFEIHFMLRSLPEQYESFKKENFQLFCTPVVNIFPLKAPPMPMGQVQTEQRIVPDPRFPEHFAVYSVEQVASTKDKSKEEVVYQELSFTDPLFDKGESGLYYSLRVAPALNVEETETYIATHLHDGSARKSKNETLALSLLCTNNLLPKHLGIGDIHVPVGKTTLSVLPFKNIVPVTPPYPPALHDDRLWKILSGMSLNYICFTDVPALRALLATYDFRAAHDLRQARLQERTLQGIKAAAQSETDRIINGLPVRGARTRLILDQKHFCCEGDMYLFGSVLHEFSGMSSTVNSFHQLMVVEANRGEEYLWPPVLGKSTRR